MALKYPFVTEAEKYAQAVISGDIPACKWTKLACERHFKDKERSRTTRSFVYVFDRSKAERVCRFYSLMPHVKGRWAAKRECIKPHPSHLFILSCLFGWVHKKTGLRRFRKVQAMLPRKNAKTTLAATVGLWMLGPEKEFGAEVYSGATTEKQAWEIFGTAHGMARTCHDYREKYDIRVNARSLVAAGSGGKFEPLIGDPGDGSSPSAALVDEYHEHDTDSMVDTMQTGMGAREHPLLFIISTSGVNLAGPCYASVREGRSLLLGTIEDDTFFYIEYGIDEGDNWTEPSSWIKANPLYGVSVSAQFLETQCKQAQYSPRKQAAFMTKHLNVWCQAASAYFDIQKWIGAADKSLQLEGFAGRRCYITGDLAAKRDIACLGFFFPPEVEGGDFAFLCRHYLPAAAVYDNPSAEHYQAWAREGWITVTDGDITDFERIEADIVAAMPVFDVQGVGLDPWNATMLMTRLQKQNVPVVEYRQTVQNFSEPMKSVEAWISGARIVHNGDPVLSWMISNIEAKEDVKRNVYPRKPSGQQDLKIDGGITLIMGAGMYLSGMTTPSRDSFYNNNPVFVTV